MKNFEKIFLKFTSLSVFATITLLLSSQSALAGTTPVGTINFSIPAGATPVPSLSATMLIVLSLLLFIVAYRVSKQKDSRNNEFFVTFIGLVALSSSIGGVKIISDVNAGVSVPEALTLTLTTDTTGSAPITGPSTNYYDNSFGVPATITSIDLLPNFSCNIPLTSLGKPADLSAPVCEVGNVIPSDEQCQLRCSSLLMTDSPLF